MIFAIFNVLFFLKKKKKNTLHLSTKEEIERVELYVKW